MRTIFSSVQDGYKKWHQSHAFIEVAGLRTSFYGPAHPDNWKKNILLIHGIGGDRHGMKPFAYELRFTHNVYVVELPGHGQTAIPANRHYTFWREWSEALLPALHAQSISIDEICAHSFGCIVAAMMKQKSIRVTLLMPVPRPTIAYVTYGRVMFMLRHLIAPWYGWYHPALWRGLVLVYRRTLQSLDVVRWVSKQTVYSSKQFLYQSRIVKEMDGFYLFDGLDDEEVRNLRIIMSSHDTFSSEDYFEMRRDIPHADIKLVSGGHMLPIESPHLLAAELYGA